MYNLYYWGGGIWWDHRIWNSCAYIYTNTWTLTGGYYEYSSRGLDINVGSLFGWNHVNFQSLGNKNNWIGMNVQFGAQLLQADGRFTGSNLYGLQYVGLGKNDLNVRNFKDFHYSQRSFSGQNSAETWNNAQTKLNQTAILCGGNNNTNYYGESTIHQYTSIGHNSSQHLGQNYVYLRQVNALGYNWAGIYNLYAQGSASEIHQVAILGGFNNIDGIALHSNKPDALLYIRQSCDFFGGGNKITLQRGNISLNIFRLNLSAFSYSETNIKKFNSRSISEYGINVGIAGLNNSYIENSGNTTLIGVNVGIASANRNHVVGGTSLMIQVNIAAFGINVAQSENSSAVTILFNVNGLNLQLAKNGAYNTQVAVNLLLGANLQLSENSSKTVQVGFNSIGVNVQLAIADNYSDRNDSIQVGLNFGGINVQCKTAVGIAVQVAINGIGLNGQVVLGEDSTYYKSHDQCYYYPTVQVGLNFYGGNFQMATAGSTIVQVAANYQGFNILLAHNYTSKNIIQFGANSDGFNAQVGIGGDLLVQASFNINGVNLQYAHDTKNLSIQVALLNKGLNVIGGITGGSGIQIGMALSKGTNLIFHVDKSISNKSIDEFSNSNNHYTVQVGVASLEVFKNIKDQLKTISKKTENAASLNDNASAIKSDLESSKNKLEMDSAFYRASVDKPNKNYDSIDSKSLREKTTTYNDEDKNKYLPSNESIVSKKLDKKGVLQQESVSLREYHNATISNDISQFRNSQNYVQPNDASFAGNLNGRTPSRPQMENALPTDMSRLASKKSNIAESTIRAARTGELAKSELDLSNANLKTLSQNAFDLLKDPKGVLSNNIIVDVSNNNYVQVGIADAFNILWQHRDLTSFRDSVRKSGYVIDDFGVQVGIASHLNLIVTIGEVNTQVVLGVSANLAKDLSSIAKSTKESFLAIKNIFSLVTDSLNNPVNDGMLRIWPAIQGRMNGVRLVNEQINSSSNINAVEEQNKVNDSLSKLFDGQFHSIDKFIEKTSGIARQFIALNLKNLTNANYIVGSQGRSIIVSLAPKNVVFSDSITDFGYYSLGALFGTSNLVGNSLFTLSDIVNGGIGAFFKTYLSKYPESFSNNISGINIFNLLYMLLSANFDAWLLKFHTIKFGQIVNMTNYDGVRYYSDAESYVGNSELLVDWLVSNTEIMIRTPEQLKMLFGIIGIAISTDDNALIYTPTTNRMHNYISNTEALGEALNLRPVYGSLSMMFRDNYNPAVGFEQWTQTLKALPMFSILNVFAENIGKLGESILSVDFDDLVNPNYRGVESIQNDVSKLFSNIGYELTRVKQSSLDKYFKDYFKFFNNDVFKNASADDINVLIGSSNTLLSGLGDDVNILAGALNQTFAGPGNDLSVMLGNSMWYGDTGHDVAIAIGSELMLRGDSGNDFILAIVDYSLSQIDNAKDKRAKLMVNGGAGDDLIIVFANGQPLQSDRSVVNNPISVIGGGGNDTIVVISKNTPVILESGDGVDLVLVNSNVDITYTIDGGVEYNLFNAPAVHSRFLTSIKELLTLSDDGGFFTYADKSFGSRIDVVSDCDNSTYIGSKFDDTFIVAGQNNKLFGGDGFDKYFMRNSLKPNSKDGAFTSIIRDFNYVEDKLIFDNTMNISIQAIKNDGTAEISSIVKYSTNNFNTWNVAKDGISYVVLDGVTPNEIFNSIGVTAVQFDDAYHKNGKSKPTDAVWNILDIISPHYSNNIIIDNNPLYLHQAIL